MVKMGLKSGRATDSGGPQGPKTGRPRSARPNSFRRLSFCVFYRVFLPRDAMHPRY